MDICGQDQASIEPDKRTFDRVIVLGWFDGPTYGVAQCSGGVKAYRFNALATDVDGKHNRSAWDAGEEVRIYSLAPLPDGAFDLLAQLLSETEMPHWPVWHWSPRSQFAAEDVESSFLQRIDDILDTATAPELAVATRVGYLQSELLAVSQVTDSDLATVQDWFAFLGIPAEE